VTRVRDDLTMVVDNKEKLQRQLDHNPGNKTSALETVGRIEIDRSAKGQPPANFDPGPIDLKDLPPLPGDPPRPSGDRPHRSRADTLKSPPDLKTDGAGPLPPLPERSLGLDL